MCDCSNKVMTGYSGKYGFQIGSSDPSCPNCRVGAFAAGDARPPMPFAQDVKPAGQSYTASAPGQTWFTGLGVRFLAASGIGCAQWTSTPRVQQLAFLRSAFTVSNIFRFPYGDPNAEIVGEFVHTVRRVFPSLGSAYQPNQAEQQLSQLLQLITSDCLRSQFVAANTPRSSLPVRPIPR